jgi:hypothetical protein
MRDLQWMADHRDQPDALYYGQRIIGWCLWKTGGLHTPGIWRAMVVLADGTRIVRYSGLFHRCISAPLQDLGVARMVIGNDFVHTDRTLLRLLAHGACAPCNRVE